MSPTIKSIISLVIVHVLAISFAFALSDHAELYRGLPLPMWLIGCAFVIQWIAFIPAYVFQTEKFFDLIGALTYTLVVCLALIATSTISLQKSIVAICVIVWAVRLGSFLFLRIRKEGKDGRFDELKPNPLRFLNVWCIQGLWVSLTTSAALVALSSKEPTDLNSLFILGFVIWLFGFWIEVIADRQKSIFKSEQENAGRFIQSGLWAYSRHPNYVGEIVLWTGVALMSVPAMQGFQWFGLVSPLFVYLLLNFVSGVPLLEERADKRWKDDEGYKHYKSRTPVLWPNLKAKPN